MQVMRDFLDSHCEWLANLLWGKPQDAVWMTHKDNQEMILDLRNRVMRETGSAIQLHVCESYSLDDGDNIMMDRDRLMVMRPRSGGLLCSPFVETKSFVFKRANQ